MKTKICFKCKKRKETDKFYQYKGGINKGYNYSYCKNCCAQYRRENCQRRKEIQNQILKNSPCHRIIKGIINRCTWKKHPYYQRGIKNFLNIDNVKYLWNRDKAYLMKNPSIDRIDIYGNYTIENCRFIELIENQKRPHANWYKKRLKHAKTRVKK